MKILVIRFRQMGDAILTTVVLNSLKKSFPGCSIDFVLNDKICPLFEGHPSIDRLIPFTEEERHNFFRYIKKVYHIVHSTHYDVIIDMRSTMNTMLFAQLSPSTRYRIGIKKGYTKLAFNCFVPRSRADQSMIDHNLDMLKPLEKEGKLALDDHFTLHITPAEQDAYDQYLKAQGIELNKPILLAGVTAKLDYKTWNEGRMTWTLQQFIQKYPDVQVIFNYAPGKEKENAYRIYEQLGKPKQVRIQVEAKSQRELVALANRVTMYFGNEGGGRHIVHACGKPSFVIVAPTTNKTTWLPQNDVPTDGIAVTDIGGRSQEQLESLDRQQKYDLITQEEVWKRWSRFIEQDQIF